MTNLSLLLLHTDHPAAMKRKEARRVAGAPVAIVAGASVAISPEAPAAVAIAVAIVARAAVAIVAEAAVMGGFHVIL